MWLVRVIAIPVWIFFSNKSRFLPNFEQLFNGAQDSLISLTCTGPMAVIYKQVTTGYMPYLMSYNCHALRCIVLLYWTVILFNIRIITWHSIICSPLVCVVGFFFLLAKRSKQDNHRANGVAEVEVTLFSKMVQEAGLDLHSGQEQDELGEKRFNNCLPSTNPTPSSFHKPGKTGTISTLFAALLFSIRSINQLTDWPTTD